MVLWGIPGAICQKLAKRERLRTMKKIYVGDFSYDMTDSTLRSLFEAFGAVESATVATDRDTGRSRGFGFVEMGNDEAGKAISALNGTDSGGRPLTVNEARPKVERAGSGGRSGSRERRW
jgi:cold-inducible RNA-binding protein